MGSQSDPLAQEPKTPPVSVSGRQRLNLMAVVGERLMVLSPLVLPVIERDDVVVIGGDDDGSMRTAPLGVLSGAVVVSVTGSSPR